MPIYASGLISAPWSVCKEIKRDKFIKMRKVFIQARHAFKYYNDTVFLSSIESNNKMEECFIASYDYSKTGMSLEVYYTRMEELIAECNRTLIKKKVTNYKFDIVGSWSIGKIVLMEKK